MIKLYFPVTQLDKATAVQSKILSSILLSLFLNLVCYVSFAFAEPTYNLDFELMNGSSAEGWRTNSSDAYIHAIDKNTFQSGKQSVSIEFKGPTKGFDEWAYSLPAHYLGKKITLRGYIKTQDVSNGWAGLWMRIDPGLAIDYMQHQGITGTTDWNQYKITLNLQPLLAETIVVGGLLVGTGKMWIDNLEIFIDDIPIDQAPIKSKALASLDTEFDKGSKVRVIMADDNTLINLDLLGRVWGFLKYYHPAVASGRYNWDYELFRILASYLKVGNQAERDNLLLEWIGTLGEIRACNKCNPASNNAVLAPDLSWISNSKLSDKLEKTLLHIYQNRSQGPHYYIASNPNAGNPKFLNENGYEDIPFPDVGFRVLALYRYWNMIQYFFPYKYLTEKDWNDLLFEYLPIFINAKNELEYELAVLSLINEAHDTHANIWSGAERIEEIRGNFFPPVVTQFIEGKLVVTDFYTARPSENDAMAAKVGLNIGDIITKINNVPIDKLIEERLTLYPASNNVTKLRNIAPDLLRSEKKSIDIEFQRNGEIRNKKLDLFAKESLNYFSWYRKDKEGKSYKLLDGNIGYVNLKNIVPDDVAKIKTEFLNTKGIIIDIRNYPSNFVPFSLGSFFVNEDTPFVKFTRANFNNPGEFEFTESLVIPKSDTTYEGKLIVLVNEITQSQAEYTSMAFRAGANTTIIGSKTAGADGNVSKISFPGGINSTISGIGVYYPDGTQTQRIGIVPDIEMLPTVNGIRAGRDELLEKAILEINKQQ